MLLLSSLSWPLPSTWNYLMVIHEESLFLKVLKYDYSLKLPLFFSLSYMFLASSSAFLTLNKTLFRTYHLIVQNHDLVRKYFKLFTAPHSDLIKLSGNYSLISINTCHLCDSERKLFGSEFLSRKFQFYDVIASFMHSETFRDVFASGKLGLIVPNDHVTFFLIADSINCWDKHTYNLLLKLWFIIDKNIINCLNHLKIFIYWCILLVLWRFIGILFILCAISLGVHRVLATGTPGKSPF